MPDVFDTIESKEKEDIFDTVSLDVFDDIASKEKKRNGFTKPPQQMVEEMMGQMTGPEQQIPFAARHPNLYAAGRTALDMPQAIGELGEAVASGMTMGLSRRMSEAGEYLSRQLFGGDKKVKESALPSYIETGGEIAGAMLPISAVGKVIAAPIIKNVIKSKNLAPFARMIGWGAAGTAYTTVEGMIQEGELPTPKEMAKHGAAWAALEGIVSSLGWGGRLAFGVNKLAKTWNIPRKEVLKTVMAEAKTRGMPIAKYAYTKAGVQKSLKAAEAQSAEKFVENVETLARKPFEKKGTYFDLVKQLKGEEISGRIKAFENFTTGQTVGMPVKPQLPKPTKPKPSGVVKPTILRTGIPKPTSEKGTTLGFGPASQLQKMYDTLAGKVKSKIKLRQNKYAGSINVKKQKIKQPYKEFQKEVSALAPKKTQTWDMTGKLSKEIVADYKKGAKTLTKAKRGEALTAVEIDAVRQINVNAINKLKEIAETKSPTQMNQQFTNYVEDIFKPVSNTLSEAGRALNILKKEVSVQRIAKAFSKIKKGLNARQLKEFKELNIENPLEVQRFLNRLPDPKFKDYFYEYWYNSILSGVPTHIVNVGSNTGWAAFQLGVHRPLKALIDIPIAALAGRQKNFYLNETIPALIGYKRAFKKGAAGAKEMVMKGNISKFETKWAREVGTSVLGAFERSPHKGLRKIAPFISAPTKALRAMDVWANTMAYDSHIYALTRRAANVKGLKGNTRKVFEQKLILNPTDNMRAEATSFAQHLTFTDDPGKFTEWIIQGRDKVPFGRLVVPFVNTIANLMKRGIEMTPGLGLTLARGKKPADVLAKQIEGSILGLYILSKVDKGEITGATPKNKGERESFYRQGKKPWSIKKDGTYYQYRRIEPFNTVIASVAIAHDAIQNAKDDETATEIFGTMVEGLLENIIDSSYLQGVTNILDKYGRRKGMVERTLSSFVPYSSFWRSVNRAYEVATTGKTLVRDTKSLMGAFSQVIPGLSDKAPARLTVWGEEIPIEGGVFRQWLPYKWSKEKEDATEKMLESLGIYPGRPGQMVTIKNKKIKLSDNIYKEYCLSYGHKAKKVLDNIVSKPSFKNKRDQLKIKQLNSILTKIRYHELQRAKNEFKKKLR